MPVGAKHLLLKLNRAKFDQMTTHLVDRARKPFNAAIKDANLTVDKIDEVVLVGGATRMPMIQDLVRDLTGGKEPNKGLNPMRSCPLAQPSRAASWPVT